MKSYLIVYQLNAPESAYSDLIAYLKTAAQWARPTESTWLIKADVDVAKVRDGIKERIKPSDRAMVIEVVNNNWATFNVLKPVTDWMKTAL